MSSGSNEEVNENGLSNESQRLRRRPFRGLLADPKTQFKLAVACSSLILIPSLIVSLTLLSDVGVYALKLAEEGTAGQEIADKIASTSATYTLIIAGTFLILSIVSILLSLKMTSRIVGPVERLEAQVEKMISGAYEARSPLRKDDYLYRLGERLDELSSILRKKSER